VSEVVPGNTPAPLGRVAAPPEHESTSGTFYFWVDKSRTVERTQIVTTTSTIADRPVGFVGIVKEVYRRSRQKDVHEEAARFDGKTAERPPFDSEGVTYAEATILRTDPVAHTPPTEESEVALAGAKEAGDGYGYAEMGQRLDVGLLKNGGTAYAGPAAIDLDYLLGENGGHLNVNGIAGLGAKTSFLLHVNSLLLAEADRQAATLGMNAKDRLQIVPVVFNVKNYDLFFIDHWGKGWQKRKEQALPEWKDYLKTDSPTPFRDVKFYAPQLKGQTNAADVGRKVQPYSWALADVIEHGLFRFLFADEDLYDANFGGLAGDLEDRLTDRHTGSLNTNGGNTATFEKLVDWFRDNGDKFPDSAPGTRGKLLRRLKFIVNEGDGVLRKDQPKGNPLVVPKAGTPGPIVIDLFAIRRTPSLQRFVVAAVLEQMIRNRSGTASVDGLRYVVTLDELNRFAPKGGTDPITKKVEEVAAEMRSQGVILLGAQQQASLVSPRVIENAGVRAVGRSGSLELTAEVWKFLPPADRTQAGQLQADEKLLVLPSFRAPMLARIPYPPWALKKEDAADPFAPAGAAPPANKPQVEPEFA